MKILISDIDGTLIRDNQSLSEKNWQSMREFQKQGHKIALCTGRNHFEIQWVLDVIDIPYDYLILNNGAQILDKEHHVLYEKLMDEKTGKDVLDYLSQFKEIMIFYSDGEVSYGCVDGHCIERITESGKKVDASFSDLYQKATGFEIISFQQENHQMDTVKTCYDYIEKHWNQTLSIYYNLQCVDIVAKGCSKGQGLQWLCQHLGIQHEDIYAVGDSYNDLSMLEKAKWGYTFVYAHEDIKSIIPRHVHYVYEIIEEMLGGKI